MDNKPEFELETYRDSLTQRQKSVGEEWIVARFDAVELSLQTHEGQFSDVCAYDHSNGDQYDAATEALQVVTNYLDELEIPFERL